ncbi:transporter [Salmonella enterica subsp. enterica]|uniref:Transporter n=1 Tax=Salmonella enterica I TaxID=59201 RepID=A0A379X3D4_SALET|nr:transporter [Salmonella enterica subsp. enterica]
MGWRRSVFLPFLRTRGHNLKTISLYMLVGAMQLGIMYMLSFHAYLYLTVSELLLFTVLTPLYITPDLRCDESSVVCAGAMHLARCWR